VIVGAAGVLVGSWFAGIPRVVTIVPDADGVARITTVPESDFRGSLDA
jgi:hypothetical protein